MSNERRIVKAYITCLAIGDLGHIGPTLYVFGKDAALDFANWNVMAYANIAVTVFLFVTRVGWLLGLFGEPFQGQKKKSL